MGTRCVPFFTYTIKFMVYFCCFTINFMGFINSILYKEEYHKIKYFEYYIPFIYYTTYNIVEKGDADGFSVRF